MTLQQRISLLAVAIGDTLQAHLLLINNDIVGEVITGITGGLVTVSTNYKTGTLRVFRGGVRTVDFTETTANSFTMSDPLTPDEILIIDFKKQ